MDVNPSYRLQGYNKAITLIIILTVAYPVSIRVIHSSYLWHSILNHAKSKSVIVWIYKICFAVEALTVYTEKKKKINGTFQYKSHLSLH